MSRKNIYYVMNPAMVLRREGKEAILYNSKNGSMEILNETGTYICNLCNGKNKTSDIILKAIKKYGGGKEKISSDIIIFLERLKKTKVIEEENEVQN